MIENAKNLSPENREILLAYLHLLHMQERLLLAHSWDWAYRTIQAHWVLPEIRYHWAG